MAVLEGFLSERQEITGLSLPVFAYGCRSTRGVSISSDCREESFVKVDSPWKLSPSALKAFFSSPQRGGIAYLNCALADSIPSDISRAIHTRDPDWHLYCKLPSMYRNTSQSVKKSSGRSSLTAAVVRGLSALLFAAAACVHAETQALSSGATTDSRKASLRDALNRWSSKLKTTGDSFNPTYEFALADKRLAIPDCSNFIVDPMNLISLDAAPASLAVDVRCPDKNWQRRIRGRRPMENIAAGKQAQPTVQVFTLARAVKKGEKLTSNTFVTELALAHRSPQNAVTQLQGRHYYAARQLLPGRILVQSDLAVGQQVVVLTQAVPSRSPVTREHMAIQERAIDIPHDAVRSLEGLSMLAANRLLHPGDILRKRDLAKAKLIKRGQSVDVESLGKHFRIASELVALQDGYLGDQIVLRNPGSNRRVSAIVTGMGTARSASRL